MRSQSARTPLFFLWINILNFADIKCATANFLEQAPQGWNWYQTPPLPEKKLSETLPSPSSQIQTSPTANLREQFKKKLEEAVSNPTLEKVREVKTLQRHIFQLATQFEDMWMLTSLLDGKDFVTTDHTNPLHRKLLEEEQDKALSLHLKLLSQQFGLFLLFSKNCSYCRAFAPIVKQFADLYGFAVMGVSANGGQLAGLKTFPDNGLINTINPSRVFPVLFLVNYENPSQLIPLAWGLSSLSDLKANAKRVLQLIEAQSQGAQNLEVRVTKKSLAGDGA